MDNDTKIRKVHVNGNKNYPGKEYRLLYPVGLVVRLAINVGRQTVRQIVLQFDNFSS